MEKTLDLKMPGVIELGREELSDVEGGIPPTHAYAALNKIVSDFMTGFIDGFKDHDYQPK